MKQLGQRLAKLEAAQPTTNAQWADALGRLADNGHLVFTGGRFIAGVDAHPNVGQIADLLNVAHERRRLDQR